MSAPGLLRHLVGRFFGSLRAQRPSPADQAWIASILTAAEAALFWQQPPMDQHHGVDAARRIGQASSDPVLIAAALLHDVGKRHSRIGVLGRSFASGFALFHLPIRRRWRTYLDHGALGAADLTTAGSAPLVIAFAGHHHRRRPTEVPPDAWANLSAADDD